MTPKDRARPGAAGKLRKRLRVIPKPPSTDPIGDDGRPSLTLEPPMFRSVALLAGLLVAAPAFAAKDPCKNVQLKKDSFGDTRILEAGDLKLVKTGGNWSFTASFAAGGGYGGFAALTFEPIPAGSTVEILLADQTIVPVTTTATAAPVTVAVFSVVVQKYALPIALSPEQLKALVAQPIKAIRVLKGTEPWYTGEISVGDAKKFQEAASCMATT